MFSTNTAGQTRTEGDLKTSWFWEASWFSTPSQAPASSLGEDLDATKPGPTQADALNHYSVLQSSMLNRGSLSKCIPEKPEKASESSQDPGKRSPSPVTSPYIAWMLSCVPAGWPRPSQKFTVTVCSSSRRTGQFP